MKVGWVAGWGIDPANLLSQVATAFPAFSHEVILPGKIESSWPRKFSYVVGWSWGAYRLLEWLIHQPDFLSAAPHAEAPKLFLIAPFLAFCSEAGQGGRCSRTQVKWLRRWLKRDPAAALADFYERGGLIKPAGSGDDWVRPDAHSPHLPFWQEELEAMETGILDVPAESLRHAASKTIKSWIGLEDSLFEPSAIATQLGATPVPRATHNISDFFPLLTKELPAS